MPHFSASIPDLLRWGPVIEISVGPSPASAKELLESRKPFAPIPVLAMIDTGAAATVVREGVPKALGLIPLTEVAIKTPSSTGLHCYQYGMELLFPNKISIDIVVTEAPMRKHDVQCLIGRDVLQQALFIYMGHSETFALSF